MLTYVMFIGPGSRDASLTTPADGKTIDGVAVSELGPGVRMRNIRGGGNDVGVDVINISVGGELIGLG